MNAGVYQPYIFVKKEEKPVATAQAIPDGELRVFTVLEHLMGSRRRWGGIDNRLIPSDGSGRIPGMGTAGMGKEELRVKRFMESCTFKAIISCAGGTFDAGRGKVALFASV